MDGHVVEAVACRLRVQVGEDRCRVVPDTRRSSVERRGRVAPVPRVGELPEGVPGVREIRCRAVEPHQATRVDVLGGNVVAVIGELAAHLRLANDGLAVSRFRGRHAEVVQDVLPRRARRRIDVQRGAHIHEALEQ